jgi:putative nucleotidyltransferase-like protein
VTAPSATFEARQPACHRSGHDEPAALALLVSLIRGESPAAMPFSVEAAERLRRLAEHEGVVPIAAEQLARLPGAPRPLVMTFDAAAKRQAAADLVREVELRRLVTRFADTGLDALLTKGAQLAYTHYPRPDLRPRLDTDFLVPVALRSAAHQQLLALGYELVPQVTGDLVMYQATYVKRRDGVNVHVVDLHWRLANPQRFGSVLTYDELAAAAAPIPALDATARGLSNPHALLLGCIHQIAHHAHAPRLIWHYDNHLVASRLTRAEWNRFVGHTIDRGVNSVCRRSLELSAHWFGTPVPDEVFSRLSVPTATDAATAAYLSPARRQIDDAVWDFQTLSTWGARWRLVTQHLFPSPRYMRDVYAPLSTAPLPVLYAKRALLGARRWFART